MKLIKLLPILLIILLSSCFKTKDNEAKLQHWLDSAQPPIIVKKHKQINKFYQYTLVDKNANLFYTDNVHYLLPDTINKINKLK